MQSDSKHQWPTRPISVTGLMLQYFARFVLWLGGWQAVGVMPNDPKALFIAAPHTSNWDAFWALTYKVAAGLDVHFFAKHTLFWFPLGTLLRGLGGIPLNRSRATSAVSLAVEMYNTKNSFYFALAPEGTRALCENWRTGFYHIALGANVPVYFGLIDYGNKHVGIGDRLDLSGDVDADLEKCARFYSRIEARWPQKASPVRFAQQKNHADTTPEQP